MKHQTIQPSGVKSTVAFSGDSGDTASLLKHTETQAAELEVRIAKMKAKLQARTDEVLVQIADAEIELAECNQLIATLKK